jgi:hypothetical protein
MDYPTAFFDHVYPDVRVESGIARAEVAQRTMSSAHAEQSAAIHAVLREASAYPETYVGEAFAGAREAPEFAVRAAVADLAVRLGLAERTIRQRAHEAETLLVRAPRVWSLFRTGDVTVANARTVVEQISTLESDGWQDFETAVLDILHLAPARFRASARGIRDRVHPESFVERHQRGAEQRRVWADADVDGMTWFGAYLPSHRAQLAMRRIDKMARELLLAPGETRTLAQLRADVAADLLGGVLGADGGAGVTVAVTVPMLALLGKDVPANLDGVSPMDAQTARELAGHAPSFLRILTDPVNGTMLDVDHTHYRPPADLARYVKIRDGICRFPGCGRSAGNCDIDHTISWDENGITSATNLALLCRDHHRLKHNSKWKVEHRAGRLHWRSPTGFASAADPPPF